MKGPRPLEWVAPNELRSVFNSLGYYTRLQAGELAAYVKRSSHLADPPPGEPECTHSQIVYCYDLDGEPLAIVHQCRRPDGSLGGSGLPDPKRLFLPDRIIAVESHPPRVRWRDR